MKRSGRLAHGADQDIYLARPANGKESDVQLMLRRDVVRLLVGAVSLHTLCAPLSATAAQGSALAISGFDTVAYFTMAKPVRGLPELSHEWDDHIYRFAHSHHRDLFRADPLRYAPQFANFCAMALANGELDDANPNHWLIVEGRLYLFSVPIGPDQFQRALADNITKANGNFQLRQTK